MNRADKRRQKKLAARAGANKGRQNTPVSGSTPPSSSVGESLRLAVQYQSAGDLARAAGICRTILQSSPNQPDALHLLGFINGQQGENDSAVDLIGKSLAIKPGNAEAHHHLGICLGKLGNYDEAVASYNKALSIKPVFAAACNNLGVALKKLNRMDEAIDSYQKALAIEPGYFQAAYNLGIAFEDSGNRKDAITAYRRALSIKPDSAEIHRIIAHIQQHDEYDEDMREMKEMYTSPGVSDEQKMHLSFGLGKAFEDLQQYEKAFEFFAAGNTLKRRSYNYSIDDAAIFFRRIEEIFDASLFSRFQDAGHDDPTPIFIVGMPRSGTTLVEQILASHKDVYGAGELDVTRRIVSSLSRHCDDTAFPESIRQANEAMLDRLGADYIRLIRRYSSDARHITNKLREDFLYIGLIRAMLPRAKVIHCRRDPVDTCLSIYKNYFVDKDDYAYDLGELGRYYTLYLDLMAHWHAVLPGFIHDVHYEDVVADQAGQTRGLLNFCGLDWDDACLEFYKTGRPVMTLSNEQVRKPIYRDSVELWKRYEAHLGPLLESLGGLPDDA